MSDPLADIPRRGGVYGDPTAGHRVDVIHAAVIVYPDGSEGLASMYTFGDDGAPVGRVTMVASEPSLVTLLRETLARVEPPPGGRFEWREYRR